VVASWHALDHSPALASRQAKEKRKTRDTKNELFLIFDVEYVHTVHAYLGSLHHFGHSVLIKST
jgi:hypothetical protein